MLSAMVIYVTGNDILLTEHLTRSHFFGTLNHRPYASDIPGRKETLLLFSDPVMKTVVSEYTLSPGPVFKISI